jgi:hypothetical protein
VFQKAELSAPKLIQRTTLEAPQRLCTSSDWMLQERPFLDAVWSGVARQEREKRGMK